MKLTTEQIQEIVDLYKQGKSMKWVASNKGYSYQSISKYIKQDIQNKIISAFERQEERKKAGTVFIVLGIILLVSAFLLLI